MTFLIIHHDHVFLEIMEFLKITIYKITIIIEDEIEIVKENEEKKKYYIYIYTSTAIHPNDQISI